MELLLQSQFLDTPIWLWAVFISLVLGLLVLDLGVFHKKEHEIEFKESMKLSAFYITIGLLFGGWIWYYMGEQKGVEYLTGFVVEKTLAMDNVFVIAMIFTFFSVPRIYQHRVLFWGILGVIILRGIMIGFGTTLVIEFSWILYIFAIFLIATGVKMLVFVSKEEKDLSHNPLLKFIKKHFLITEKLHDQKFFIKQENPKTGKITTYMTPLFLALIFIEIADVIFAVDSIPAIFAITTDPYIVYTSNIFAILGLRALYFALASMVERFQYLKYALAVLLIFIGSKIFVGDFLMESGKFPAELSLAVTIVILVSGVIFSLWKTRKAS